jgi:hypothetical protein
MPARGFTLSVDLSLAQRSFTRGECRFRLINEAYEVKKKWVENYAVFYFSGIVLLKKICYEVFVKQNKKKEFSIYYL